MTGKYLHIVCFDVPYPVDYGGVFDLFYKLQSLYELGVHIHLHCFEYGRGKQSELNKFCESVTYYKRNNFYRSISFRIPYIVSSRASRLLLYNLLKDDYPVLLEGIHCTYFLDSGELKNKKVLVRLHNVEHEYYEELAKTTNDIFRKIYLTIEGILLKKYEKSVAGKVLLIAVSQKDKETYQQKFRAKEIQYLPVFLPFNKVTPEEGSGSFCLYHGNLSVPENEKAALWLMKNVFHTLDIPFVVAGKNPSKNLKNVAYSNENFCIVENPSNDEMKDLIKKAHIHLLPSFNKTGVKIKLLHALFNGRHVITNAEAVDDVNLASLCHIAEDVDAYKKIVKDLFNIPFTERNIEERKKVLENIYDNSGNAQTLMQWIW